MVTVQLYPSKRLDLAGRPSWFDTVGSLLRQGNKHGGLWEVCKAF